MGDDAEARTPRDEALLDSLARQASVMQAMAAAARATETTGDATSTCLGWLGLQRQADRYLRNFGARGRAARRWTTEVDAHRRLLEDHRDAAARRLRAADPAAVQDAQRRAGLRVAVIGKGGAGKSMISGTLARILARQGHSVLAADLDTNPGLAFSMGLAPDVGGLPAEALEEHAGAAYGWRLRSGLSPAQAVERFSVPAPDGARFLPVGKIDEPDKAAAKRTLVALLEVLRGFGDPSWDVIGDLEAGPTTPFERYHAFADRVLVVVGPAWRSAMTARRLLPLVADVPTLVVANRFGDEADHPGLSPVVRIPFDADVAEAERQGLAPLDCCPGSPAITAVASLATLLTDSGLIHQEVPV